MVTDVTPYYIMTAYMSRYIARTTTILTLLATILLLPVALSAQSNTTESPYSRFGLGMPSEEWAD